jgi:hypothetical protein
VGIGALFAERDGARSLLVAQMFAAQPERIDPADAADAIAEKLNETRSSSGAAPFVRDTWLDARAKEAARSCGKGAIASSAVSEKKPAFHLLTAVQIRGGTVAQIAQGLASNGTVKNRELSHFGVAARRIDDSATGICVVVMLGSKE